MVEGLSSSQVRKLKGMAQLLDPVLKVGKEGLSDGFLKSVEEVLAVHELVKVRFAAFKEEKKQLSVLLAEKTSSFLVARIGNVAVLYRANADLAKQKISL